MALTKEIVISNSIALLGHAPIITLDNADDVVIAAEQAYDMLLPSVLATGDWRFATQIAQLSKMVATPNPPWEAIYSLPADYLKLLRIYPQTYDFDIFENLKIYTMFNSDSPYYIEYVFQPDTSRLPLYFVNYFVFEIAAYLSLSNAQKPEYYNVLEARRVQQMGMAHAVDAQNRPQRVQQMFPVLNNRYLNSTIPGGFVNT